MNPRSLAVMLAWEALITLGGCAAHNVRHNAFLKWKMEPAAQATVVHGRIDEAKALAEQSNLPHHSVRSRFELQRRAGETLRSQLGSQDYLIIGEVYGGGNAYTTVDTLKAALSKKAAKIGGDVVMIFNVGVQERPFVYTAPGHATTNVYGSAYRTGNYAYGSATGYSTYTPGTTFAGVMRFPHANGLVFKYVPRVEERQEALASLSDSALERALQELEALIANEEVSFEEGLRRWDRILAKAKEP